MGAKNTTPQKIKSFVFCAHFSCAWVGGHRLNSNHGLRVCSNRRTHFKLGTHPSFFRLLKHHSREALHIVFEKFPHHYICELQAIGHSPLSVFPLEVPCYKTTEQSVYRQVITQARNFQAAVILFGNSAGCRPNMYSVPPPLPLLFLSPHIHKITPCRLYRTVDTTS